MERAPPVAVAQKCRARAAIARGDRGCPLATGTKRMFFLYSYLGPGEPLDVAHVGSLLGIAKRQGDARGSRPSGTTDPMDIALRYVRHFKINDVRHRVDVNSASGDVGRDQNPDRPALERAQRAFPRALRFVPMNYIRRNTCREQVLGEAVGSTFGAGEHQRFGNRAVLEKMKQEGPFVVSCHMVDPLLDGVRGAIRR